MWIFESAMSKVQGEGEVPDDAIIDALGEDIYFDAEEVTTDEEEIVVRDGNGDIMGWCHWVD